MKSAIGDVWKSDYGCVYLIVGVIKLEHAKGGWVWDMRALYEPPVGLAPGRWVHMHPEYLEEHLDRVVRAR
jgi:hypothetical protein